MQPGTLPRPAPIWCIANSTDSCAPIARAHRAYRAAEEQLFAGFLLQGAREGAFSVKQPAVAARALMWSYDTFSPPALFLRDEREVLRDLDLLHQLVLRGLLAR